MKVGEPLPAASASPEADAAERDIVVLVDENDAEIGLMPKLQAHTRPGLLHRAVSAFVLDSDGRMLLQRRSPRKYHFPNLWSNACCTHPMRNEHPLDAAHRRLAEEMGIRGRWKSGFEFVYEAFDPESGLYEAEYDHVFVFECDQEPRPDPEEVADWRWLATDDVQLWLEDSPYDFTPWFKAICKHPYSRTGQ